MKTLHRPLILKLVSTVSLVLFMCIASPLSALNINKYLSGSWYNPQQAGHGLSVEVLPDGRTIIFWYSYHPDGTPMFIVAIGESSGSTVIAEAYYNTGMRFGEFDPADREQTPWGTLRLTYNSCTSVTLAYESTATHDGVPFSSGSIPMVRLGTIDGLQCSTQPAAGLYRGNFYSNALDQVIPGWIAVAPNGEFAAISFEAMAGVGSWSTNGNNFSGSGTAVSADPGFTFSSSLSFSGQFSQDYLLIGNYSVLGGDYGTFEFYALPTLYRRGFALSAVTGSWNARNLVSGGGGTVNISATGSLSGSDSLGCGYSGQLTVPDEQFNLFRIEVTVSSCGVSNGVYEGYGAQFDYYSLDDGRSLLMVGTNGQYAGVIQLYR